MKQVDRKALVLTVAAGISIGSDFPAKQTAADVSAVRSDVAQ